MPTGQPLDDDDREADSLIEYLEHQIADITELNEPMVTWDGVGGLVQPADETVVGDGENGEA